MTFTADEISLMNRIGLNFNFTQLSDEQLCEIEDKVGDFLVLKCLDQEYTPTADGLLCESILDKLA